MSRAAWLLWVPLRWVGEGPTLACDPSPCRYGDAKTVDVYNPGARPLYGYVDLDLYFAGTGGSGPSWGTADPDILARRVDKSPIWFALPAHGRKRLVYRTSDLNPFYHGRGPYYRFSLHYAAAKRNGQERVAFSQTFRID